MNYNNIVFEYLSVRCPVYGRYIPAEDTFRRIKGRSCYINTYLDFIDIDNHPTKRDM